MANDKRILVQKIVFFCTKELIVLYRRMQSFVQNSNKESRKTFLFIWNKFYSLVSNTVA